MDYGIKVLKELIDRIDKTPIEELRAIVMEADFRFRKIQSRRGINTKTPVIQRENYKESLFYDAGPDFSFKVAA